MSISLVLERDGTPKLLPDDRFTGYGIKVRDWLVDRVTGEMGGGDPSFETSRLAKRCQAFARAEHLYVEAAHSVYKLGDPLRHEPWVVEAWNSGEEKLTVTFIFKCENNGNTYRVTWDEAE